MNGLSLFSGIGGLDVALSDYVRTIACCEIDPYCQGVLLSRMASRDIDNAPIWDDVKTLNGRDLENVDIIYGGFPCQDISIAGNGKGLAGERSGLFFEILRLAKEIKPKFIFLENVPAICRRGGERVVASITALGYDCRWCVISAASVGACHKRERWFLLAYSNNNGPSPSENRGSPGEFPLSREEQKEQKESVGKTERTAQLFSDVANSQSERPQEERQPLREEAAQPRSASGIELGIWHKGEKSPPPFCRVDDDVSFELDLLIFICEELDEQRCKKEYFEKTNTEIDLFNREILRAMWINRGLATTSPELYFRRMCDCVPNLPQEYSFKRKNLGKELQERSYLYHLFSKFYSETQQTKQVMWQKRLLVSLWEIKCSEKMAQEFRIDRIKALGNAVVAAQAKEAFKILMGLACS